MLKRVDRILVAVNDLDKAEKNYHEILGAARIKDFKSDYLNANIRLMALGSSEVELCAPSGEGPVKTHLGQFGEGLIRGGVTTNDLNVFHQYLKDHKVGCIEADGRLYPEASDLYNLPLVVSREPSTPNERTHGPVNFLYELTLVLRSNWQDVATAYVDRLGVKREHMVNMNNSRFAYVGALMMFEPQQERLDRIELSEAHDEAFPMGRFSRKRGDALYMCYIETDDIADIIQRLDSRKLPWTPRSSTSQERDGLWIPPSVLNGVLMGVSRTSHAWQWSGHPERVQPLVDEET